jgi:hypothetical protein
MAGRQLLRPATGSRQHTASLCSPLNRYLSFYIGNRLRERERHAIPLVCRCRSSTDYKRLIRERSDGQPIKEKEKEEEG